MKLNQILHEGYEAYVIDDRMRATLAQRFPPKFPEWIGHHVTYRFGVQRTPDEPYGERVDIEVIGYAMEDGLEALVCKVNGEVRRPDGKIYHITWSLDRSKGMKPAMSNNLIAQHGFQYVDPVKIFGTLEYLD